MAATILLRRRRYYSALEAANKRNEITDWLAWSAATALEAQARAIARIGFLVDKARLLDRLRGQLNERQDWMESARRLRAITPHVLRHICIT